MKISNSKKELARIISENGGWRDMSEFASQDGDGTGSIDFFESKPRYDKDSKYWNGKYDYHNRIKYADVTIKNFHQTILSREEYFHLHPAPDADGWIEWMGGKCPVDHGTLLDVKFEDGMVMLGAPAGTTGDEFERHLIDWSGDVYDGSRIEAYRLHKPEQAKPEFCESVTRQTPEPKPAIEQLAADYRNRKDYADLKQQEADAAKDDAEAKLEELVAAGKALNLVIGVSEKEPELVITDWRNLRVGDVIKCVGHSWNDKFKDNQAIVSDVAGDHYGGSLVIHAEIDGVFDWGNNFKFIRRP